MVTALRVQAFTEGFAGGAVAAPANAWLPHPVTGPRSARRARVLVLDSDEIVLRVTERMLARLGYDPVATTRAAVVAQLYEQAAAAGQPFALILIDPAACRGPTALELLARLRQVDPGLRAILSGSYCSCPPTAEYARYGFAAALPKPFTLDELGQVLMLVSGARN